MLRGVSKSYVIASGGCTGQVLLGSTSDPLLALAVVVPGHDCELEFARFAFILKEPRIGFLLLGLSLPATPGKAVERSQDKLRLFYHGLIPGFSSGR